MNEEKDLFDDMLRDLMQEAGVERAPANFTQAVMGQVSAASNRLAPKPKPLISRWGWIGIAASTVLIAVVGIFGLPGSRNAIVDRPAVTKALQSTSSLFEHIQVPTILAVSILAIAVLFAVDRYLGNRRDQAL